MPSTSGISTQSGHTAALQARHSAISEQIEEKQKNRAANEIEIRMLKKMKLRLKEEIEGIRRYEATN
jgi:hypothetical protein